MGPLILDPPRAVLTVFSWTPDVMQDWVANGRGAVDTLDVFASERGGQVTESTLLRRLRRYCDILELPPGLDLHSLRLADAELARNLGDRPR